MKFKARSSDLKKAVSDAESVASRNLTQTIKHSILLEADAGSGLSLTATDLDNILRVRLEKIEVAESGKTLISGIKLKGILAVFGQEDVIEASCEGNALFLRGGGFEFHIPTLPTQELPVFDFALSGVSATFPSRAFQRCVKLVEFARATDDKRAPLMGVHVEASENYVRFVASDGRRVACVESPTAASASSSVLLSHSFIDGVMRLLPNDSELVLSFDGAHAKATAGGYAYKGKVMAEAYPNWRSAVPTCAKAVMLDREPLLAAFKAAGLIDYKVRMKFHDLACEVSSVSKEGGDARFSFALPSPTESLEIIFTDNTIIDALAAMDSSNVEFRFNDGASTATFKMPGDDRYFCSVHPMVPAR